MGTTADAIETQGRLILPFYVQNHEAAIEFKLSANRATISSKLRATVKQPGATSIVIRQNSRDIGRVQGEAGDIELSAATLGRGASVLQAFSEGPAPAAAAPIRVQVD